MNLRKLTFALALLFLALTLIILRGSHLHNFALGSNRLRTTDLQHEITLNHWLLLGPFPFKPEDLSSQNPNASRAGLNQDFLAPFGHPETSASVDSIVSLCTHSSICRPYSNQGSVLLFDHVFPGTNYAVIYASAEFFSQQDADLGLELGSDDGAKVWLNGQPLLQTANTLNRAAFKYTHLLPIHIRKGNNFLLVKVDQKTDTWDLIISFLPLDQLHSAALQAADHHLLENRLLNAGDPLTVYLPPSLTPIAGKVSVANWQGYTVFATNKTLASVLALQLPSLRDGYYSLTLQFPTTILHDSFYVGHTDSVFTTFRREQSRYGPSTEEFKQRSPVIQRYSILTSPQYFRPQDPDWQKKMLMVLHEIIQINHSPREAKWSHLPGSHLRQFISQIDGTPQNYLLYLPHRLCAPFPLVLVLPYAEKPVRPFLESSLLAWPDDLEDLEQAAETSGVAVAIIDSRGSFGDDSLGEKGALEVLRDIRTHYTIDNGRLYLYGTCEGGRRALLLAEHYPHMFAAVGTYGPLITIRGPALQGATLPMPQIDQQDETFRLVKNLAFTPIILLKGEFDTLTSTATLKDFHNQLVAIGAVSTLDILPDGMHKQKKLEARIFPRLIPYRKSRINAPPD